ncbi:hypothetical protein RFI_28939 [Reticulomyxa filosa]|uniref:Uncharacterized protein n=1 Tax=Reticulomyxa filosa TaxID=46433 RepID=X6M4R1_RETFI|nr:hypothetical protein RFI_28939 [Reticulomyxa filosa]|eukprot:ETO08447.1 hypothetical protein RFI_28939 [Reticulomyxa filosa]
MKRLSQLFSRAKTTGVVHSVLKHLSQLDNMRKRNSAIEKLTEDLKSLQFMLYGDPDHEASIKEIQKLMPMLVETDDEGHNLIYKLCKHLKELEFEGKKRAAQIICFVVRRCTKTDLPKYLRTHSEMVQYLIEGFEDHQLAQHAGSVLQEMAKRSEIGPMLFDIRCNTEKTANTIIFKSSLLRRVSSLYLDRCAQMKIFFFLPKGEEQRRREGKKKEETTSSKKKKLINNKKKRESFAKSVAEVTSSLNMETKDNVVNQEETKKNSVNEVTTFNERKMSDNGLTKCLEVSTQNDCDIPSIELTARDVVTRLIIYSHNPNLIIASDAFEVLNILFTKHRDHGKRYMEEHFVEMVKYFNGSIMSENYVNQGKFLKLFGDILLARSNHKIRMLYLQDRNNLRIIMTLLKNNSRLISFEAFQIFKIFVANPNKTDQVHIILFKNRDKLVKLLEDFQTQREESDSDFKQEKIILIQKLKDLGKPPTQTSIAQQQNTS